MGAVWDVVGGPVGQGAAVSVVWFTRIARARPGVTVGWQWQRAWVEVFLSALMTYSSALSGPSLDR
ncbi:hypothetical protein OG883_16630 [Streptomyces sp. NBC_01142]|uniref:hypothetical protein n=1 Tax=Streptomyces sp. NBC_01142 TaxID=2975865 RepID=UPI00225408E6|nr:hypothetical protein [Streptomyces sp. NBC_01142]MCX4821493.1 hypothetical protein [Streptomyces sp. NBC_01142]